MNKVGVCYHPKLREEMGRRMAEQLRAAAARHVAESWIAPAWDEALTTQHMPGTDLVVSVGGDGTVLRVARAIIPHRALILGVNMGRLGFLTELDAAEALDRLADIISGQGRIEERSMLHAQIVPQDGAGGEETPASHEALNDVVIGRTTLGRTVQVTVRVDGAGLADLRADGIIVATATGSTAYSLSAGGPILHPEAREILVTPVAPHLAMSNPMVLPETAVVEIALPPRQQVSLSIDGEPEMDLAASERVRLARSLHTTRFIRLGPPSEYYEHLSRRLGWVAGDAPAAPQRLSALVHEETTA
jgi:NAD+ kinase